MTIAERTRFKSAQLGELGARIKAILRTKGRALDLPTIEFYLKAEHVESSGHAIEMDTFEVRDAVSKLMERGEAAYTEDDEIRLI